MKFKAEIIRTSQRKLVSNDNQYEIVLRTVNPQILDLGKLKGTTLVDVEISLSSDIAEPDDFSDDEKAGV